MQSNSNCVVISQPMYFPWAGMIEQIRICDTFIYYDDIQFSKGSFSNRVQIKTEHGIKWLTVPLSGLKLGQNINEAKIDHSKGWKRNHRDQLKHAYKAAPFRADMLDLIDEVFASDYKTISELSCASTNSLVRYFKPIGNNKSFLKSSSLNVHGASTQRVIDLCKSVKATTYLTGHGARNYLDHMAFEQNGMTVQYMDYGLEKYPQLHGDFTPYVSALDLIANCGREGVRFIHGNPIPWREFIDRYHDHESEK